ncbi:hypothetical protein G4B88_015784 [Cannabis sativa]|uniref:Uncharacterized protein n=1 Tax=Cannabis sativa TaxID=3483 RepID=A0A7J6EQC7_CANSA|nr:hypothetical protein G4B88_015784 [Cannabis sativa]
MRSTKPALQTTRKTPTQQGRRRSSNLSSALGAILPTRNSATTITIASLNPDTSARLAGEKTRRLSLPPPVSLVPVLVPTPKTIPAHHPRRILGGELRWLRTLDKSIPPSCDNKKGTKKKTLELSKPSLKSPLNRKGLPKTVPKGNKLGCISNPTT